MNRSRLFRSRVSLFARAFCFFCARKLPLRTSKELQQMNVNRTILRSLHSHGPLLWRELAVCKKPVVVVGGLDFFSGSFHYLRHRIKFYHPLTLFWKYFCFQFQISKENEACSVPHICRSCSQPYCTIIPFYSRVVAPGW